LSASGDAGALLAGVSAGFGDVLDPLAAAPDVEAPEPAADEPEAGAEELDPLAVARDADPEVGVLSPALGALVLAAPDAGAAEVCPGFAGELEPLAEVVLAGFAPVAPAVAAPGASVGGTTGFGLGGTPCACTLASPCFKSAPEVAPGAAGCVGRNHTSITSRA